MGIELAAIGRQVVALANYTMANFGENVKIAVSNYIYGLNLCKPARGDITLNLYPILQGFYPWSVESMSKSYPFFF